MSLASIRIAARLLIVAALAGLNAGCFQPMYAEHTDGTPGLREKLMGVEVPPVDKPNASQEARLQVEIRNALAVPRPLAPRGIMWASMRNIIRSKSLPTNPS